jgi:hypothetical protein
MARFREWLSESVWFDYTIGTIPKSVYKIFNEGMLMEMPRWIRPELKGSEEERHFTSQGYIPLDQGKHGPHRGKPIWWKPKQGETFLQGGGVPGSVGGGESRSGGGAAARPVPPQSQSGVSGEPARWFLAKSKIDAPQYRLKVGQHLAAAQLDQNNWKFVALDLDDGLLMDLGTIPVANIAQVIERVAGEGGAVISGSKPSEVLKAAMPKKDKKISGTIPDEKMTEEGRNIEQRFEQMISGDAANHMVIGALAGTGKTTILGHLAAKYGKRGQNWLYIVFNKKNESEAQGKFPSFVKVRTSNGFAGDVLDNNDVKPTERIIQHSDSDKSKMIADGPQFQEVMKSLKIPDPDNLPPDLRNRAFIGFVKSINYNFKRAALTLMGLAKAYAVDPRQPETLAKAIADVIDKHDIDTDLEEVKERLEKHPQSSYYNEKLSELMGVGDFLATDFTEQVKQATQWLLEKTQPHGIDQEFTPDKGQARGGVRGGDKRNLKGMRDFDDDTWYLALHANEIDWTKPKKWDVVLVDETQDFNKARQIMVGKIAETGAKVVVVGDPNQAIYRFIGADAEAFSKLTADMQQRSTNPEGVSQQLSLNFRSRQEILDHVNQKTIMAELADQGKGLKAGKQYAVKGNVTDHELKYDDAVSTLEQEFGHMGEVKPTAFISPTNQPLAGIALEMMKKGIPFVLVGKDLARDLATHIDRTTRSKQLWGDNDLYKLVDALREHLEDKKEKWGTSAAKAGKLQDLRDTTEALLGAAEHMEDGTTIDQFKKWLFQRLGGVDLDNARQRKQFEKQMEEQNPVVLTTAHKSKGLEFDRVYIVGDNLFQHPKRRRPEDQAEGERLRYVAYTRAMRELHVLDTEKEPGEIGK